MKQRKKMIVFLFVLAVVLLILHFYDVYVLMAKRKEDFTVSPISLFCIYVGNPAFWASVGALIILVFSEKFSLRVCNKRLSLVFLWCGILLVAVYVAVLLCYLNQVSDFSSSLAAWMTKNSVFFLVPGALIAMYQKDER